ncbi:MAG: hypothetical protein KAS32_19355 [Candidatus Peribacteraceae bacterium]|nr:hypothetical protein [Candidatus Peribacteraceae bacterium]
MPRKMMTTLWFDKSEKARLACDLLGVDRRKVITIRDPDNDRACQCFHMWKYMKNKPPGDEPTHKIRVDAMLLENHYNFEAVAGLAVNDETDW